MRLRTLALVTAMTFCSPHATASAPVPEVPAVRLKLGEKAPYAGTLTETWVWEAELTKRTKCELSLIEAEKQRDLNSVAAAECQATCLVDAAEAGALLRACREHVIKCEDAKVPQPVEATGPSWGTTFALSAASALVAVLLYAAATH